MAPNSRFHIALALLLTSVFSAPAMAADGITQVTLSPSNMVVLGTTVTVTVHGTGSCAWVMVETNGASPVEGGLGDYLFEPGNFPLSVSFETHETGSFLIAALGADAEDNLCVEGGDFAKNTTLQVLHPGDPRLFEGRLQPIPKPRPWVDPGPLRHDPVQPQLGPEGLSRSPVANPVRRRQTLVGQRPQAASQPRLAPARKPTAAANPTGSMSSAAPPPHAGGADSR